jgi:hypothetical protein
MGVYVVRCLRGPYIKIGYYELNDKRPNVYFHFINRGLGSYLHPDVLDDLLDFKDLELTLCYPYLTRNDEKAVHRFMRYWFNSVGEFYPVHTLNTLAEFIEARFNGEIVMPTDGDLAVAREWCRRIH